MKKLYFSIFVFVIAMQAAAQIPDSAKPNSLRNFKLFSQQINKRFEKGEEEVERNKAGNKPLTEADLDGGKAKWKRLEHVYSTHLDKDGNMINYVQQNDLALKEMQMPGMEAVGNWQAVGPFNTDQGIGRVNCMAFIDADTWLVGTAGGGLWKTDVAGVYLPGIPPYDKPWTPLTDNNAVLSVSGIAVRPSAPNKIYILTGDGDWGINDAGIVPNTPSLGILKTTNGGSTWTTTALTFGKSELVSAHKLIMHPTNASKMYAATSKGLYYTADGWATDTLLLSGNIWDVEFHPTDNKIIYISTSKKLYISTDGLATSPTDITNRLNGLDADGVRIKIAVSAAAPDNLYVIAANGGLNDDNYGLDAIWLSTNKGTSFTTMLDGHDLNILAHDGSEDVYADGQAEYDLAFAVDPNNASKIMVGGIGMWASITAGITWAHVCYEGSSGDDYVHADIHTIEFNPFSNTIVCGSDGGLFSSPGNNDTYWEKRWAGLSVTQFYHFDVNNASSYFATEIIGGAQDNGIHVNSIGALLSAGDGFDPIDFEKIDGSDGFNTFSGRGDITEYRYTEAQNGLISLQTRDPVFGAWGSFGITPANEIGDDGKGLGSWDTPLEVNPNEFQSILTGYDDLYFSNNYGSNWNVIWSKPGPSTIHEIAWNKNNGNNIAFYSENVGLVSTNQLYFGIISGNYNWQEENIFDITGDYLPISDIQFTDDAYPNNLVITIPGYTDSVKVFRTMKDSTWKNISYNLPNTPALSAAVDEFGIYVGTDIGVFFLADKDSVWTYFSKGLPTVPVTQIEVVQDIIGRRVYCSTFGRGIWKSDPAPPKRTTRYYVNYAAGGANNGTSWADAFTKVQDAVYKAIPGDTIWVAKGTYRPTSTYNITGGSAARLYTFIIDSNTVIYGGFAGTETSLSQRNISLNLTEFTGDIGVPVTATDNAYHVLTILKSTKNSLIDGFRIRDGYANGTNSAYPALYRGGAILLAYDSTNAGRPFFKNCEFVNNLAAQGGAVYISQYFKSDVKTSFLKCTFSQNYTFNNGYGERGGAVCVDASLNSSGPFGTVALVIDSCVFQYNNSPNGGALYNNALYSGNIKYTINQTQFLHNKTITAGGYGGAITNYTSNKGKLSLTLNNCTFLDDDAPNAGGAIYNSGSSTLNDDDMQVYVKNCSFDSCSGYAIYSTAGKIKLEVDKSVFTNNSGGIQHVGATADSLSRGVITRCTFTNTGTGINLACNNSGTGLTNKSINYSIDSCTFTNNSYGLYLYNYSQGGNAKHAQYTLTNSTFTGNTSGAVYNFGSDNCNITATLKKNTFTNNQGTNGGAMYSYSSSSGIIQLYIDSCNFTGNKASASGGALYNYNTDIVSVSNCNFNNDTAATGGAVYNNATYKNVLYKMDFRNCTYTNNKATGSAGALFFANGGFSAININVIKNTFTGNTAANYGGSLYISTDANYDTANVIIDSCNFNNNTTTLNTTQSHGGALYVYSTGSLFPVIKNSEFKNNQAAARGGAIYAETGAYHKLNLSLLNCNIESNSSNIYGGGLYVASFGTSNLSIDGCTIKNNSAVSAIGGVYIYQTSFQCNASITNTIFDGNTTPGYSGALQINADGPITGSANNCIFKNNTATGVAGAVRLYAYDGDLNDFDFNNCLFDNNTALDNGGAAYIQTDLRGIIASKFDNCVFHNNKAARGGTLYLTASNYAANISVPLTNCTIANNNATIETGGIYVTKTSTTAIVHADLVNTILWNNTDAGATAYKKQAYVSGGATGFVKNCLIKDSIPTGYADSANNIFTDPLFINDNDADGADNIFATTDDGFAVQSGSPAINAGTVVTLSTDITGLSRPQGSAYDMGAYESLGCSVGTVTGLVLNTATSCSLKYTWNAVSGAISYEAAYKLNSSGTWTSLGDIGNVLTKTITGLTANTAYDFRVRAKKSSSCKGNWAQLLNKLTLQYDIPTNPSESNITATSARLKWQVPACGSIPVNYTIMGKPSASNTWITINVTGTAYTASGLSPSTQYTWKVRANYSGGSSLYTIPRNFTTAATAAIAKNTNTEISDSIYNSRNMALLGQNIPNPFAGKTTINYSLPLRYRSANIAIINKSGIIIEFVQLKGSGKGSITFNAPFIASGTYNYSLYVDGKLVETKQMVLIR